MNRKLIGILVATLLISAILISVKSLETVGPNDPPIPIITTNQNPASSNENIHFSATESSDPDKDDLSYLWIFAIVMLINSS